MTLTTVGYGDIIPQNLLEYSICTVFMLVSGYIWAFVVGSVVALLQNLDPHGLKFKQQVDEMNHLMYFRGVPHHLQVRLRSYMYEASSIKRHDEQLQFLESNFTRGLQREIAQCTSNANLISGLYWACADEVEEDARLELVKAFR